MAADDVRPEIVDEGPDPRPGGPDRPGPTPGPTGDELLAEHVRAQIERNKEIVWHQAAVACLQAGTSPELAGQWADDYLKRYCERMIRPGKPYFGLPGDRGKAA